MSFHPKLLLYHEGRTEKGLQNLAEGALLLSRVTKSHLVGGEEPASWCICIRRSHQKYSICQRPANTWHLKGLRNPCLSPWLRCPRCSIFIKAVLSSEHSSPVFSWGQRGQQDVYSLHMDLVFIYLSITMFIFVHVLTVSSLLPPTGLIPALACDLPSLWALPLLQEMLGGGEPGRTCCWEMHLGPGSPVRI